jgi:Transglycosylase-like domain
MTHESPYEKYEPHPNTLLARVNVPELLRALAACESGFNDSAINDRSGARGRYQIKAGCWYHYGTGPHTNAHIEPLATAAAVKYINSLARILLDHKQVIEVRLLAQLWHQGTLHADWSFADRVTNLYNDACTTQTPFNPQS